MVTWPISACAVREDCVLQVQNSTQGRFCLNLHAGRAAKVRYLTGWTADRKAEWAMSILLPDRDQPASVEAHWLSRAKALPAATGRTREWISNPFGETA